MKTATNKINLRRYILLALCICFGIFNSYSQEVDLRTCGYDCTTNSFTIEDVYLSSTDVPGTRLTNTSCIVGTPIDVYMIMEVSSNRAAAVHCARVFADLMVNDILTPINKFLGTLPSSNAGTTEKLVFGPFT